jgi:DNA-binding CsgD family transcriptional regulator/tetratricopeptide (TPR) repeat protein
VIRPQIIGRAGELAYLEQALASLNAGRGELLGLVGDPGIGKTRLLEELIGRAEDMGVRVIRGWGRECACGVPLALFGDLLYECEHGVSGVAAGSPDGGRGTGGGHAAEALAWPDPGQDGPVRYLVYRRLREFIVDCSRRSGALVALDDVHWADAASAEVLTYLLCGRVPGPVLIVLAYRPNQVSTRVAAAVQEAVGQGRMSLVRLAPLTREAAGELVGPAVARARFEELYVLSAGNPFYLEALRDAEAIASSGPGGRMVPHGVAASLPRPAGSIPPGVASALLSELEGMPETARCTALAAAVAGEPIEPALTASIAVLPLAAVLASVDELQRRDILRRSTRDNGLWFRHPLLRQVVYESAGAGWLVAAHERASRYLARQQVPPVIQAFHVERAALPGDLSAVAILTGAGDQALRRAPATAAYWYQAALRLLPGHEHHRGERAALRLGLGYALGLAGQLHQARQVCRELLEDSRPPDPLRMQAVLMSAALERLLARHNEAAALLRAELAAAGDEGAPEQIPLLLELACHHYLVQDHDAHLNQAARAMELAEKHADRGHIATAATLLSLAHSSRAEIPDALRYLDRVTQIIDELTDDAIVANPEIFIGLGSAETYLDRYDCAIRHLHRGVALVRATGRDFTLSTLLSTLAAAYLGAGRLGVAAETARDAFDAALVTGIDQQRMLALSVLSDIAWSGGDYPAALEPAAQAAEIAARFTDWLGAAVRGNAALISAVCGSGSADLEEYVACYGGPGLPRLNAAVRPRAFAELSRAEFLRGEPRLARGWAERAQRCAAELGLRSAAGHAALARAELRLASDPAAALPDAQAAVVSFRRAGAGLLAARAIVTVGKALSLLGRPAEAGAELRLAENSFTAAGAPLLAAEARRLWERTSTGPGQRPTGAHDGVRALSQRERQVAWLIADGNTNRQIARVLGVSDKTVEVHVSHILKKLAVPSRAAVATVVMRSGPVQ